MRYSKKALSPPGLDWPGVQAKTDSSGLILSALKKADRDRGVIVRVYDIAGEAGRTPVRLFGRPVDFTRTDVLEETRAPRPRRLWK